MPLRCSSLHFYISVKDYIFSLFVIHLAKIMFIQIVFFLFLQKMKNTILYYNTGIHLQRSGPDIRMSRENAQILISISNNIWKSMKLMHHLLLSYKMSRLVYNLHELIYIVWPVIQNVIWILIPSEVYNSGETINLCSNCLVDYEIGQKFLRFLDKMESFCYIF